MIKLHLAKNGKVTISCPQCSYAKLVDASRIRAFTAPIKVKCKCGNIFSVSIDRRAYYRKSVRLNGAYNNVNEIIIIDLSMSGIRFKYKNNIPNIAIDDQANLSFILDNKSQTIIRTIAEIRYISDKIFGAEFQKLDKHLKKDLWYYLLP